MHKKLPDIIRSENLSFGFYSIMLFAFFIVLPIKTMAQPVNVNALKAVFLFNFANFMEWPASSFNDANEPIRYCTMENLRIHKNLLKVTHNEMVKGREFRLFVVNSMSEIEKEQCHLLFIGNSSLESHSISLFALAKKNILTVGESPDFLSMGGMLNLKHENKRVKIEIGMDNVKNSQLGISSKLLRLGILK